MASKQGKSSSSTKPMSTLIISTNWLAKTSRGSRVPRATWFTESLRNVSNLALTAKCYVIILKTPKSRTAYPERLRRVVARVIVNDEEKIKVFITNSMKLAASSICDLYKSGWAIEVLFKELKQCLQLCDFVWSGLLFGASVFVVLL